MLAWEEDDKSKDNKFRLFLIKAERETVYIGHGDHGDGPLIEPREIEETIIVYRKPLRQTKLAIRLSFSEYLKVFVDEFENYLRTQCIIIKEGKRKLPFPF